MIPTNVRIHKRPDFSN